MAKSGRFCSRLGGKLLRFATVGCIFGFVLTAPAQTQAPSQNPAFSCGTRTFTTPHFIHYFDNAVVQKINPMNRIGPPAHPYRNVCPGNVINDFVLETAYYLECAWETYESGFKKMGLQMPAPVRGRIPVVYDSVNPDKIPLQFRHESVLYQEGINVWLKPERLSRALHLQRTAHELFHFIQGHAVGAAKCGNDSAPGKWWIEATAEYAACDVAWSNQNLKKYNILNLMQVGGRTYPLGLSNEKGGGSFRAYPYLLDYPLRSLGLPDNSHAMPYFQSDNWDKGEELEYDKGYFVQFLMDYCGADFFAMNIAVFSHYRLSGGPTAIFDPLEKYLRNLTPARTLAEAYQGFASYYLLSRESPLVRHQVFIGGATLASTPLVSIVKPPRGAERETAKIPPADLNPPLEFSFQLPGGFSARMLALELNHQANGLAQHDRVLQVAAVQEDGSEIEIFRESKNQWLGGVRPMPLDSLRSASWAPAAVKLGDGDFLYIVVSGADAEKEGAAVIRIFDPPSLTISPPALQGVKPLSPSAFKATLRNSFITGAVKFIWKLSGLASLKNPIPGETKVLDKRTDVLTVSQSIAFPQAGRYELTCVALDSKGAVIAESRPALCEVEGVVSGKAEPASSPGSGFWRISEIHIQKLKSTITPGDLVEFTVSVGEGSMSGKVTTDNHVGEGPATWGGQCLWTWKAPHGLDRLVPGETIEGRMTLTDQSLPEQKSGWQHGYTGVAGAIRIDRPFIALGSVDASAQDLVNLNAPYKQTKTQEGKLAVPGGSGGANWGGKIALAAMSSFGRVERVYEWTTEPYVPGRTVPVTGDVKPGESSSTGASFPEGPATTDAKPGQADKSGDAAKNTPTAPSSPGDMLGKWAYYADAYYVNDTHEFLPEGRMGNDPKGTWTLADGGLTVRWPNGWVNEYSWDPKAGAWKGIATNKEGTRVDIRLVRIGPPPASRQDASPRAQRAQPAEKEQGKKESSTILGRVWRVHEASSELSYDGIWTRRGSSNTFDAVWKAAGVSDTITIESLSADRVVLFRQGNGGRYIGTLSPDRKRIISGTMSWAPTFSWTATIE